MHISSYCLKDAGIIRIGAFGTIIVSINDLIQRKSLWRLHFKKARTINCLRR